MGSIHSELWGREGAAYTKGVNVERRDRNKDVYKTLLDVRSRPGCRGVGWSPAF